MGWKTDKETGERRFEPDEITTGIDIPALTNPEDIAKFATEKLVRIMATLPDTDKALPVIREVLDRLQGKPMQRQQSMVALADATKSLPENERAALEHYFKTRGF